jgi:hypothetical protein
MTHKKENAILSPSLNPSPLMGEVRVGVKKGGRSSAFFWVIFPLNFTILYI